MTVTVGTYGFRGRTVLPSAIFDKLNGSSPSWSSNFHHFATLWTPRGSLTEGHVKVMLAYGHSLSYDHQGFASGPSVLIIEKQRGQQGQRGKAA